MMSVNLTSEFSLLRSACCWSGERLDLRSYGPIQGDQPEGTTWATNFPHTAWFDMSEYYITAFKTGTYPAITVRALSTGLWSDVRLRLLSLISKTLSITGLDHIRLMQLHQAIASHGRQGTTGQRYGISACKETLQAIYYWLYSNSGFHVGRGFRHIPSIRDTTDRKFIVHFPSNRRRKQTQNSSCCGSNVGQDGQEWSDHHRANVYRFCLYQ